MGAAATGGKDCNVAGVDGVSFAADGKLIDASDVGTNAGTEGIGNTDEATACVVFVLELVNSLAATPEGVLTGGVAVGLF